MSHTSIITDYPKIRNFLLMIRLLFLLTKPQHQHIVNFIAATTQQGYQGKVTNVVDLSHAETHRTSFGKFLSKSSWNEDLVHRAAQRHILKQIWNESIRSGKPIYVIADDTIAERTKPSSKAKNPIQQCSFHHSHLKNKVVYGHQVVGVLLICGSLKLPYTVSLYIKEQMSKIQMIINIIATLPKPPNKAYIMADSWYSADKLIKVCRKQGYHFIGAVKTNRVIYPVGKRLGEQIKVYAKQLTAKDYHLVTVGKQEYWVYRYEGKLNGLSKAIILISWPKNALFKEGALKAFISTEIELSTTAILNHYANRWPIEIFFRQNKMNLGLDKYQVRTSRAIKRYWILMILSYVYCCESVDTNTCNAFGEGLRKARQETKAHVVKCIYEQALAGISLEEILKRVVA